MKIFECRHKAVVLITENYEVYLQCQDCSWRSAGWEVPAGKLAYINSEAQTRMMKHAIDRIQ